MIVKCKLYFRKCERKTFDDKEIFKVYFLDENDNSFIFNFPAIKENEKYLRMQKDTLCDLDLLLYSPSDRTKAKYSLMGL